MSVVKLLQRVVDKGLSAADTSQHSYGIADDPLAQFACVFSALVHDVDHPGVPNSLLVKENAFMVTVYSGKSTAEQNSIGKIISCLERVEPFVILYAYLY